MSRRRISGSAIVVRISVARDGDLLSSASLEQTTYGNVGINLISSSGPPSSPRYFCGNENGLENRHADGDDGCSSPIRALDDWYSSRFNRGFVSCKELS
jgi:hypothetical protein